MDDDFASALATLGEKPQSFAPPDQQTSRPSNNPGNLRPIGASQGFQSFATPEDGLSAIDKNLLAYHKHGINSISGVINRWAPPSENNTNAYIADVSKRLSVHPDQQIDLSNPIVRQALTTAINLHENGPGILTRKSSPSAAPQQAAAPAAPAAPAQDDDFTNAINMSSAPAAQTAPARPVQTPQAAPAQGAPLTQSLASAMPLPSVKLASLVAQKYLPQDMNPKVDTSGVTQNQKSLGASAVALGDTLASAPGAMVKQLEYAAARALGERPEDATERSNHGLGAFLENPVSKFVNGAGRLINGADPKIEDSAGYKSEASQSVMKFVGDNIGKGSKWISEKTGLPAADVENMINTGVMGVAPSVSKGVGKVAGKVAAGADKTIDTISKYSGKASAYVDGLNQELAGNKPLSSMLKAGESPAPESNGTTVPLSGMAPAKPAYKLVNGKPVLIDPDQSIPAVTPPIGPAKPLGSALPVPPEPQAPLTPAVAMPKTADAIQETAQSNPAGLFPELPTHAPTGTKFSTAEQLARAQTMVDVGVNPSRLRKSAITGDHLSGATDHATSLLDDVGGRIMRSDLEQEKAAISNSALQISKDAGGTTGLAQNERETRGNTIIEPIDKFRKYLDDKTSKLYQQKDAVAQGIPTNLTSIVDELNKKSNITTTQDVLLKDNVRAYAEEIGMLKPDGSISGSVLDAEKLRKHLNASYKYENSTLNIKLKNAIDNDTFTPEDGLIYKDARALRAYRANTLDNPQGISRLAESSGPDGINRKVQIEGIPNHLASLPVAQFRHIVDTMRDMPPELSSSSGKALAEIKSHFANLYHAAGTSQVGQWNAKGATTFLQDNASRMAHLFTPKEMAQFRKINDAGHIMAKGQAYPGAAAQSHNLLTNGLMASTTAAGGAAGYFAGDAMGGAVGAFLGNQVSKKIGDAAMVRAVNNRMVKLSDLANTK